MSDEIGPVVLEARTKTIQIPLPKRCSKIPRVSAAAGAEDIKATPIGLWPRPKNARADTKLIPFSCAGPQGRGVVARGVSPGCVPQKYS